MDPVSSLMIRSSLIWLVTGLVGGSLILLDASFPGLWRTWLTPGHVHMLLVGWFLQFALGVAIWLFPRRRTPAQPRGYNEYIAMFAVLALNLGLVLRVVFEALDRANHSWGITTVAYAISAIAQVLAVTLIAWGLWPRVAVRPAKKSVNGG